MSTALDPGVLDALAAALETERRALIERDSEALRQASVVKDDCMRLLASCDVGQSPPRQWVDRLQALADLNRANGELIVRRRRDVEWTLTHLGRGTTATGYDPSGAMNSSPTARALARV